MHGLPGQYNNYQISDFGMSRNLMDENYYISHGGKVPVKWTAPEVSGRRYQMTYGKNVMIICSLTRPFITRSTPLPVMCGALVVSCMRYGVSDTNHLKATRIQK